MYILQTVSDFMKPLSTYVPNLVYRYILIFLQNKLYHNFTDQTMRPVVSLKMLLSNCLLLLRIHVLVEISVICINIS